MAKTQHERNAEQIHGPFRWRHFDLDERSENIHDGTLEECASALRLDPNEVEWAIEEFGRCDTQFPSEPGDGVVAWKPGPIETDNGEPDGEPIQGGFEWPATEAPQQ